MQVAATPTAPHQYKANPTKEKPGAHDNGVRPWREQSDVTSEAASATTRAQAGSAAVTFDVTSVPVGFVADGFCDHRDLLIQPQNGCVVIL